MWVSLYSKLQYKTNSLTYNFQSKPFYTLAMQYCHIITTFKHRNSLHIKQLSSSAAKFTNFKCPWKYFSSFLFLASWYVKEKNNSAQCLHFLVVFFGIFNYRKCIKMLITIRCIIWQRTYVLLSYNTLYNRVHMYCFYIILYTLYCMTENICAAVI